MDTADYRLAGGLSWCDGCGAVERFSKTIFWMNALGFGTILLDFVMLTFYLTHGCSFVMMIGCIPGQWYCERIHGFRGIGLTSKSSAVL